MKKSSKADVENIEKKPEVEKTDKPAVEEIKLEIPLDAKPNEKGEIVLDVPVQTETPKNEVDPGKEGKVINLKIPRFTIIIPCYNGAGYIVRCLNSIKEQTFDLNKVQVIAVDDASTDGSGDIFEAFGKDIPDFTIIKNEENLGVGASRNDAITHAKGKYIYFIDVDDYLTKGALERIDKALTDAKDPDVAFLPFKTLNEKGEIMHKPDGRNYQTAFSTCPPGPWCKVFKRALFVPFPVGFRAEDTVWHFVQIDKFNSYCVVTGDEPCYMYDRTNVSAITDTLMWSSQNALTLEHLAQENDAIKAGKNDKFFSDVLRAIAEMYDSRHKITKPFIRNLWFIRFRTMYQSMVCGHFHN